MPLMIAEGGLLSVLQTVLGKTSEDLQAYLGCLYDGDGLRLAIPANYHAEAGAMDTFAPPKVHGDSHCQCRRSPFRLHHVIKKSYYQSSHIYLEIPRNS